MGSTNRKKNRMLEIFFRAMKGENLSVKALADEYGVSTKSISRDIAEIRNFLSNSREMVGNTELKYISVSKTYCLEFDNFLLSKELLALIEMMIGCRAFSKEELLEIVRKLKSFTTYHDRKMLERLISKETYHYKGVKSDCGGVIDHLWQLVRFIDEKIEITINYYRADRVLIERRIKPIAIIFSEYYFYLIAYHSNSDSCKPIYYRVDRIVKITEHRNHFEINKALDFDEGELKSKIQFMQPGEYRKIKFSYSGNSVQAILDRIPTARIVECKNGTQIIEAETYGKGINMFLLSQGAMVKALAPESFVEEMKCEIKRMLEIYDNN